MNPAVKEFVRLMVDIDRSKHRSEVFSDFCELAYCALAKAACPVEDQREALEQQYMSVVGRYRDKDDIRKMPELLGMALGEIGKGGCDYLGQVSGELGVLDSRAGQFFTPFEVSRMMAEINLSDAERIIKEQGFITVCEPAAGAGGMLMAVADVIEGMGYNPETSLWIEATELSRTTYHMCYLQCTARGLAGKVICGNSITLEQYTSAYTAAAHGFVSEHGDPFARQREEAALRQVQHEQAARKSEAERQDRFGNLVSGSEIAGEQMLLF